MVRIVTDSTSDIPKDWAEELGIFVVPAIVTFGMESFREGVELSTSELYSRMVISPHHPTTSQPSAGEFMEAYSKASEGGHELFAIHLGSAFSGLINSARLGVEMMPQAPVTVYDSGLLSMAMGLLVLEAARAAKEGATRNELTALMDSLRPRTRVVAALDTLEYLRRGGRLSLFSATLGKILSIRPTIQVYESVLSQLARTRHRENSLHRLVQIAESRAPFERLVVLHTAAHETASRVAERLTHLNSGAKPAIIEAGAVIGTHAGPGAVGFACVSRR